MIHDHDAYRVVATERIILACVVRASLHLGVFVSGPVFPWDPSSCQAMIGLLLHRDLPLGGEIDHD